MPPCNRTAASDDGGITGRYMWDRLSVEQLLPQVDSSMAQSLFKQSVTMIEIEVFSHCNRRCWFCPNSKIDRMSGNTRMQESLYSSIIDQLAEIDFAGMVTYSRYNEPLSDRIILDRLREARGKLPGATLHANTNGDYLNPDYLAELYEAGMRSLNIQFYLQNEERYDHDRIHQRADQTLGRLGLPATLTVDDPGSWLEYRLTYRDMQLRAYGRNFELNGTNRGNQIDIRTDYVRTLPCLMPFWSVYIDFNGMMMLCCNVRSDIPEHADYAIADLAVTGDIFLGYAGTRAAMLRRSLLTTEEKAGLCRSCHFAFPELTDERIEKMRALQAAASERAAGSTGMQPVSSGKY